MAFVLLVLAACFPPPADESGRKCDLTTHPCGTGYFCFDGLCALLESIDAGPDNWVDNGSFERLTDAGLPQLWRALPASSGGEIASDNTQSHDGLRSVRLFSPDGGDAPGVMQTVVPVKNTHEGEIWCARAWVKSNQPDGGMSAQLFIRERPDDGGQNVAENTPSRVRIFPTWVALEERYVTTGAERMDVRVAEGSRVRKEEVMWVDDVRLKRIVTGECTW